MSGAGVKGVFEDLVYEVRWILLSIRSGPISELGKDCF